jgi:hypothetical protein
MPRRSRLVESSRLERGAAVCFLWVRVRSNKRSSRLESVFASEVRASQCANLEPGRQGLVVCFLSLLLFAQNRVELSENCPSRESVWAPDTGALGRTVAGGAVDKVAAALGIGADPWRRTKGSRPAGGCTQSPAVETTDGRSDPAGRDCSLPWPSPRSAMPRSWPALNQIFIATMIGSQNAECKDVHTVGFPDFSRAGGQGSAKSPPKGIFSTPNAVSVRIPLPRDT